MPNFEQKLGAAALVPALAVFAWSAAESLSYWHWGDEDEKIVAAWMIGEGYHLYDTLFAHHGPLNYALAHLTYLATGSVELAPYRLLQWGLMLLAGVAVAASPLLSDWPRRATAFSLFCVLSALLSPLWYGHTLLYHAQGGIAMTVALSLLLLPMTFGLRPGRLQAAAGGAGLAAAGFTAYPLAVPALMLISAALVLIHARGLRLVDWRGSLVTAAVGFAVFSVLMLLWLLLYGDLLGYGIYHVWFNQAVYTQFIDFDVGGAWRQLGRLFKSPLGWVLWTVVLVSFLAIADVIASRQTAHTIRGRLRQSVWPIAGWAALVSGLLFLNPRGAEVYQSAPLWIVGLGLLSLLICLRPADFGATRTLRYIRWAALLLAVATPGYLVGWKGLSDVPERFVSTDYAKKKRVDYARRAKLVQGLVSSGEPILAVVFSPRWYLLTKRLPSSGAYYYLPWQAAYNQSPVLGYRIDPCGDVAKAPPKVIAWDRWRVWDRYDVADYAPCLVEAMRHDYLAIKGTPLLLRKPVGADDLALVKAQGFDLEPVAEPN